MGHRTQLQREAVTHSPSNPTTSYVLQGRQASSQSEEVGNPTSWLIVTNAVRSHSFPWSSGAGGSGKRFQ